MLKLINNKRKIVTESAQGNIFVYGATSVYRLGISFRKYPCLVYSCSILKFDRNEVFYDIYSICGV